MTDFKITVDVKESDVESALCSAFESGIRYWAWTKAQSYHEEPGIRYQWSSSAIPLKDGGFVQLVCSDEPERVCKPLNRETLAEGLRLMAQDHPRHFADLVSDDGRDDATTGDVLVQLACFGELVYG